MRFAGARVRVVEVERLVHIYHGDTLIRVLTINPDRYYQPKPGKEPPPNGEESPKFPERRIAHQSGTNTREPEGAHKSWPHWVEYRSNHM